MLLPSLCVNKLDKEGQSIEFAAFHMIFPEISERFLSRGRILLFSNRGLDGCCLSEYFTKFKIRTAFFCCWRGTRKGLGVLLITHFRLHFTCGRGGGAERSNISDQSSPVHTIMTARSHLTIMAEIEDKPVNHLQKNHGS